jgi:hypothetical protein
MTPAEIREQVRRLDTTSVPEEAAAWEPLRDLGAAVVPYLAEAYPTFRKWQGRRALVYHSIRYARASDEAFQLGLQALSDKATQVRYRACALLAYSQRRDALPHLAPLRDHPDHATAADARAAIDAIARGNHHYFIDRDHTGRSFWQVNAGDTAA